VDVVAGVELALVAVVVVGVVVAGGGLVAVDVDGVVVEVLEPPLLL
jgi:hypothetical protein